jgi:NADH-quinone oxidoreductase subunit J
MIMIKFILLSMVIILAVIALLQKKTVPSVIAFVVMMFLLGIYYLLMDEKLLGLFQIFVYTGGIVVLTLFGVTVIGAEYPEIKNRPWAIVVILIVTIGFLIVPFILPSDGLAHRQLPVEEQVKVFTDHYSELVLFLGVVASSILYGGIRMLHTLKYEKE